MKFTLLFSLLALALGACATGSPGSYQQAAPAYRPVRPPPVLTPGYSPNTLAEPGHTPAGTGLYRPDAPGQGVPRSPNRRILPATNEPGVWAADGDPSLSATSPTTPKILGVPLPLSPDGKSAAAGSCAATVAEILKRLDVEQTLLSLPEPTRRCAAALLYEQCIQESKVVDPWDYRAYRPKRKQDQIVADLRRQKDRYYSEDEKRARAFVKAVCPGVGAGRPDILDAVARYWETSRRNAR